ncbi:MAG: hypothetical protein IPJ34_32405 [Myxococcales bacterium]|nr:hypothetical protein [Myxococcales bacterium]
MLKTLRSAVVLGAVGLLMACSVGCGGSSDTSRPAVTELREGLNILKTEGAIVGAYRKGDRAIYFETRAGEKTLDVYRNLDPSLPEHEMDLRVMDDSGRTFYVQQGGDTLPEGWEKDIAAEASRPRVDPVRRADDFGLMKEAALAMESADVPVAVKAHKVSFAATKLGVRDDMLRPAVEKAVRRSATPRPTTPSSSTASGSSGASPSTRRPGATSTASSGTTASTATAPRA